MATKTATGGAWNVAGNWSPSGIPLAADDVIIPTGINQNIPTSATVQCRSLTVDSGATFTGNASATTQIGTSTPGPGNVALSISSGATVTWTAGTIQFVSTSTTQQTISTGGKTIAGIQQSGVGSNYVLLDALTCGAFTMSAGTFDTASYAVTWTSFAHSGTGTKVFSPGSSTIICTSANTPWSSTGTNFTLSSNTCTIKLTPGVNQATWTTASGSWYNVENNGVGNFLSGALTCENFTYTCDANQARIVQFSGNLTVNGTFTITGNSAINRPTVVSSILGVARTITAAATAISGGVDWRDIAGAGAAAPFVASSGYMGDRLGNSGITLTTPATQTRDATAGQQWGVAARWTSRVPLPQDDVVLGASSGSISGTDVLCLGRNLDFSAYTNTLTLTSSSTEYQVHGDVILGSGMVFGAIPNTFYVDYRGRGPQAITSNGLPLFRATSNPRANFYPIGGSYEFVDDVWIHTSSAGTAVINHYAGTLDLGAGLSHIIASIASTTTTYARFITAGAGTTMTAPATGAASIINFSTTNLTTSLSELTLTISTPSTATRSIVSGPTNPIGTVNYTIDDSPGPLSLAAATGTVIENLNLVSGSSLLVNGPAFVKTLTGTGEDFDGQKTFGVAASSTISQPDATPLRITGDITIDYKLTVPDWSPAGRFALGGKINGALTTGWCVRLATTGAVEIICGGVTNGQQSTSVGVPFADGDTGYIRVQRATATGALTCYTSTDGTTWTQLGTMPTSNAGALIANTTDPMYFGSRGAGGDAMNAGVMHRAVVYDALMGTAAIGSSDVVSDVRFEDKTVGDDTFTESSSNAATVTITGVVQNGDGRLAIMSTSAGSPSFLALCDRPTMDYVKTKDIFPVTSGKLYVGANGMIDSGCTNVHTGAFDPTDPYIRQYVDVSGTAFAFPVLAGNLLAAAVSSTTAAPAWSTPAGYTVIARSSAAGPNQVETYSKIADGSETSFTTTTTGGAVSCKCWEVVGADTLDVSDENSGSAVTTLDASAAPLTTYGGGKTLGVAVWGGNAFGASGAYTDGYGESRNATIASHFRAATRALPAGATTDPNFSWTGNQNPRSQLLVFKATAAAPSTNRGVLTGAAGIGF